VRLRKKHFKKARIEIVPMIDTIFFLLVFFMISSLSMTYYKGMPVNLPKAASGQQSPAENASVTVTREGQLFLDKEPMDIKNLEDRLREQFARSPELLVVINADDGVEHGKVVEVMDTARNAGVAKLAIAVKPKEDRP
jgi:biopolymer transport protein ExbD